MPETEKNYVIFRVTLIGAILNILFSGVKILAGIRFHSTAVLSDGLHSFSDLISDFVILLGLKWWSKPADDNHAHGHGKLENLAEITVAVLIILTGIQMFISAFHSIRSAGEAMVLHPALLWITGITLFGKEFLYRYTIFQGQKVHSVVLIANAWHHRSDALGSIPVLIGVGLSFYHPQWRIFDPLAAMFVCLILVHAGVKMLIPSFDKLIDGSLPIQAVEELQKRILSTDGVLGLHRLRTRYVSGSRIAVDVHICVDGSLSVIEGHQIADRVEDGLIQFRKDLVEVLVHVDPVGEEHDAHD